MAVCPTCSSETTHIKVIGDKTGCHNCMGFSETGGSSTDKILTRSSERVLEQQIQNEGDQIPPYVVDKNTNQPVVNQDFIDKYPQQSADTFTAEELDSIGQPGLKKLYKTESDPGDGIQYSGDEEQAISNIVEKI